MKKIIFLSLMAMLFFGSVSSYGQSSVLNHNAKFDTVTFKEAGWDDRSGMRMYTFSSTAVNDSFVFVNGDGTVMLSFVPVSNSGTINNDTMVVVIGGYGLELPILTDTAGTGKLPTGVLFVSETDTFRITDNDTTNWIQTTKHLHSP